MVGSHSQQWRSTFASGTEKTSPQVVLRGLDEPDLPVSGRGSEPSTSSSTKPPPEAIKSVSSQYRVGGPASARHVRFEQSYWTTAGEATFPLDFHFHALLRGEGRLRRRETGRQGTVLDGTRRRSVPAWCIREKSSSGRISESRAALHGMEFFLYSGRTPSRPVPPRRLYLDKIKGAQGLGDLGWTYWVLRTSSRRTPPSYSLPWWIRAAELSGIRKPAYQCVPVLNQFRKQELLSSDAASWVTRDPAGDVPALFWDFTPLSTRSNERPGLL